MADVPEDTLPENSSKLAVTPYDRFSKRSKSIPTIPFDIFPDILSKLPVTSLMRFRCVCKSWKVIIESPLFINLHLNHSGHRISNSNLNKYLVVKQHCLRFFNRLKESSEIDPSAVFSEDLDSLTKTYRAKFSKLSYPQFDSRKRRSEILGSCDGLLVLSKGEDDIVLWNPSIRRFKIIPPPPPGIVFSFIVYGFGYGSLSDDYNKLVRIVQSCGITAPVPPITSQVEVYSVKRNSWKQIADFPYYLRVRWGNGEFVNGALHWIVGTARVMQHMFDKVDCLVGAFDLETEDYRLVHLPKFANDDGFRIINLGALGGCLTVVCDHYENHDPIDFWVMKEYGVEGSWSLLFRLSFACYSDVCGGWGFLDVIVPLAYSDCGRKVLIGSSRGTLMWYDLDRNSCDKPVVRNICHVIHPVTYMEDVHICLKSLVMLNNSISDCDFAMVTKNKEEKYGKYQSSTYRFKFLRSWFRF